MFDVMDRNHDGVLSREEFNTMMTSPGAAGLSAKPVAVI